MGFWRNKHVGKGKGKGKGTEGGSRMKVSSLLFQLRVGVVDPSGLIFFRKKGGHSINFIKFISL